MIHSDSFLWLHCVFALVYFVITLLCMAHHSIRLEYREDDKVGQGPNTIPVTQARTHFVVPRLCLGLVSTSWLLRVLQVARTLMITSIPREISDPGLITKHFQYRCFLTLIPVKSSTCVSFCLSFVQKDARVPHLITFIIGSLVRPTPAVLSLISVSALMSTN